MKAWLGLGTNVGDRLANLRSACDALEAHGVQVLARSGVYETEPQAGAVGQQDFLNACVEVETGLEPEDLLAECKAIEVEMGRDLSAPRHSPRPIDIDLLLVEAGAHRSAKLQIPHPDLTSRRFVLEPLLELDPPGREELERALALTRDQRVTPFGTL